LGVAKSGDSTQAGGQAVRPVIPIYGVSVPKAKLAAMLPEERQLLLVLGHVENEISTLRRLVAFSLQAEHSDPVIDQVAHGRAQVVIRLLIGKLHEGHQVVKKRIQSSPIGRKYKNKLDPSASAALDSLNKYFGKSGLLSQLRKFHVFHYPDGQRIEDGFASVGEAESWDFYLATANGNSFYHASEMVMHYAMLRELGPLEPKAAIPKLASEVMGAAGALSEFLHRFIATIIQQSPGLAGNPRIVAEVADAPAVAEVSIPPFCN
jgi:hypothetical protein